jgi:hypothetical protein
LFLKSCDPEGRKKHCVKMGDITNHLEKMRNTVPSRGLVIKIANFCRCYCG